jgi:4-hydroxybenzoate polyprenyltransferase
MLLEAPPARRTRVWNDLAKLCRPRQWLKNLFVLAPLLFTPPSWQPEKVLIAALAALCFCLWSSSVYCLNDVLDAESDGRHPRKQNRPIPSGRISARLALTLALLMCLASLVLALAFLPFVVLFWGSAYLANSVVYCVVAKHHNIADVMAIAIGFVIRLLAGCAAIGVGPSSWLLVCGFSLAMLLGFGKRRLELDGMEQPVAYRAALQHYSVPKLNMLLTVTTSLCLISYMLYTVSPQTIEVHHTDKLVYTVPLVAYGIFRYLFKVQEGQHDGPVDILLKDPVFALTGFLWVLTVIVILYVRPLLAGATEWIPS